MSKDHFIAQTYLRRFGDPSNKGMLHAYRKSDGKTFLCRTQDVCHEWDGDLNPLLDQNGLLGDYRKLFEPKWNVSVEALLQQSLSPEEKFAASGYFANLMVCTPAWRRIGCSIYDRQALGFLTFSRQTQEKHGGNDELPVEGIRMLEKGELVLEHNPDFIKGTVTLQLLQYAWLTYHQDWTIIRNSTEFPFLTSDNPVAIQQYGNIRKPPTRYLPITPNLCLAVKYDRRQVPPFNPTLPPTGCVLWANAKPMRAISINKLIAQCAEDLVFNSHASSGIETLVKNSARFRVEADYVETPAEGEEAIYQGTIIRVRDTRRTKAKK